MMTTTEILSDGRLLLERALKTSGQSNFLKHSILIEHALKDAQCACIALQEIANRKSMAKPIEVEL